LVAERRGESEPEALRFSVDVNEGGATVVALAGELDSAAVGELGARLAEGRPRDRRRGRAQRPHLHRLVGSHGAAAGKDAGGPREPCLHAPGDTRPSRQGARADGARQGVPDRGVLVAPHCRDKGGRRDSACHGRPTPPLSQCPQQDSKRPEHALGGGEVPPHLRVLPAMTAASPHALPVMPTGGVRTTTASQEQSGAPGGDDVPGARPGCPEVHHLPYADAQEVVIERVTAAA
jgi:hypothetical protein